MYARLQNSCLRTLLLCYCNIGKYLVEAWIRFNQVMIADYFGLTVPADEYAQLSKTFKNLKVSDDIREYGLHLDANGFNTFSRRTILLFEKLS